MSAVIISLVRIKSDRKETEEEKNEAKSTKKRNKE
jgi:hypothetical protein